LRGRSACGPPSRCAKDEGPEGGVRRPFLPAQRRPWATAAARKKPQPGRRRRRAQTPQLDWELARQLLPLGRDLHTPPPAAFSPAPAAFSASRRSPCRWDRLRQPCSTSPPPITWRRRALSASQPRVLHGTWLPQKGQLPKPRAPATSGQICRAEPGPATIAKGAAAFGVATPYPRSRHAHQNQQSLPSSCRCCASWLRRGHCRAGRRSGCGIRRGCRRYSAGTDRCWHRCPARI
jgi:hypothetical protein